MTVVLLVAGMLALIVGAEALVKGASRLAAARGLSPLVIGLTVVAFGTSSPELAVSLDAALGGRADIALGNVVGSNVFNVLFILGLSALIVPLAVNSQLVRLDVPLMIALSLLTWGFAADGRIGRAEGLVLVATLTAYIALLIRQSRREAAAPAAVAALAAATAPGADNAARAEGTSPATASAAPSAPSRPGVDLGLIVVGLGLLVLGSHWLVESAVDVARGLGVSELVIGLTLVAAGTSLPEVVTSVVAALRGERDIAVGNVVGSNIFNLAGVLGLACVAAPDGVAVAPGALRFDLPVMVAVALATLPIGFTGGRIARWEGALLLAWYAAYTTWLILTAGGHVALPGYRAALLGFALPLTALTLMVLALREWRRRD